MRVLSPRLVATDLDGTLVRGDRTISPRTAGLLRRLAADGVPVVLVTGRPLRWLAEAYEQLAAAPLAVLVNGAAVYDPGVDEVIHSVRLPPELLAECVDRIVAVVPEAVFAVERDAGRWLYHEDAYPIGGWERGHPHVYRVSRADLFAEPAAKLLARPAPVRWSSEDPSSGDGFTGLVARSLAGLAEATNSTSSGLAEISAAGVTKATGLAWVADRLGVPAGDIVAFGDMPNDLPMLTWVGHGVAMANAHPDVLAASDAVAASNDEDGVAAYLERLFPPSILELSG